MEKADFASPNPFEALDEAEKDEGDEETNHEEVCVDDCACGNGLTQKGSK